MKGCQGKGDVYDSYYLTLQATAFCFKHETNEYIICDHSEFDVFAATRRA